MVCKSLLSLIAVEVYKYYNCFSTAHDASDVALVLPIKGDTPFVFLIHCQH